MAHSLLDALARYARRLHACAGDGHHVVSPLGAWLVLALCAPLAGGGNGTLDDALGLAPDAARAAAAALLDHPHPLVAAGAAAWTDPQLQARALRRWLDDLPRSVTRGAVPTPAAIDAWARERTLGLVERFPLVAAADAAVVLASVLATKVSWEQPFEVVDAAGLGPGSAWDGQVRRVLRAPVDDPRHLQYLTDTPEAGLVGVHLAVAQGGLLVGSVVAADTAAPQAVLQAAQRVVTAEARQRRSVPAVSLFDLSLGDGPICSIIDEPVLTAARSGREERLVSLLPAWSATTTVGLGDERLGFPAAAAAVAAAADRDRIGYGAAQTTTASYGATGFEAAAATGLFATVSAVVPKAGRRRTATVRFARPYAVVAAVDGAPRRSDETEHGRWEGLPVFSAWVSRPEDAAAAASP